ncbi:MAG: hypothetical protein OXN25_21070 [Candidatus Poribacteria bacterium]|nr:hypothetical protein [Candidatus Poribacteria bacterium]
MPRTHLKCIAIASGISVILGLSFVLPQTQSRPAAPHDKKVAVNTQKSKTTASSFGIRQTPAAEQTPHFRDTEFYRTIIDNNLLRPLGWRPPRPREPYRLLGTTIPTSGEMPPQAILQTTSRNQTRTISLGEKLDVDTTLIDIQPKQVTLEKIGEKPRILTLNTTPVIQ